MPPLGNITLTPDDVEQQRKTYHLQLPGINVFLKKTHGRLLWLSGWKQERRELEWADSDDR